MTLLTVVQEFCRRTGLVVPSYVAGNLDDQIIQLQGLVNEVMEDLVNRFDWQELVCESVFTTAATESQGALATLAPTGFLHILNDTIYNRSLRLPIFGPLTARNWQARKALPATGPLNSYRLRGGQLLLNPTPVAGHTCAFEYASSACILASDGTTRKSQWTDDEDTFLLDPQLLQAGLRWKWRSEKGLPYSEEFARYEALINNAKGRDNTKGVLSMDASDQSALPGIFITPGGWNLS